MIAAADSACYNSGMNEETNADKECIVVFPLYWHPVTSLRECIIFGIVLVSTHRRKVYFELAHEDSFSLARVLAFDPVGGMFRKSFSSIIELLSRIKQKAESASQEEFETIIRNSLPTGHFDNVWFSDYPIAVLIDSPNNNTDGLKEILHNQYRMLVENRGR